MQNVGKVALRPDAMHVDAFSLSFHKIHGPRGWACWRCATLSSRVRHHFAHLRDPELRAAWQNREHPGIAASFAATKLTFANRLEKVTQIARLRETIRAGIGTRFPTFYLDEYREGKATPAVARAEKGGPGVVVWIAPKDPTHIIPGTLFFSVFRPRFCNIRTRAAFEEHGVIVSVGAACSTAESHASATVEAMDVPAELRSGVLRVSMGDDCTADDVKKFVKAFITIMRSTDCLKKAD